MAQGTHVSRNLLYDNDAQDLFVEVSHGPFLVDNNLFLSKVSQRSLSQGGAYVHNLFCGGITITDLDSRKTPYRKARSTEIVGLHDNPSGDMRFYNNLFAQASDLSPFNAVRLPMQLGGNVFVGNAKPCTLESAPLTEPEFDPKIELSRTNDNILLAITHNEKWVEQPRKIITTELLGNAIVPICPLNSRMRPRSGLIPIIPDASEIRPAHSRVHSNVLSEEGSRFGSSSDIRFSDANFGLAGSKLGVVPYKKRSCGLCMGYYAGLRQISLVTLPTKAPLSRGRMPALQRTARP